MPFYIQTREDDGEDCNCQYCVQQRRKEQYDIPKVTYIKPCELVKSVTDKVLGPSERDTNSNSSSNFIPELSRNPDDWYLAEKRRKGLL